MINIRFIRYGVLKKYLLDNGYSHEEIKMIIPRIRAMKPVIKKELVSLLADPVYKPYIRMKYFKFDELLRFFDGNYINTFLYANWLLEAPDEAAENFILNYKQDDLVISEKTAAKINELYKDEFAKLPKEQPEDESDIHVAD